MRNFNMTLVASGTMDMGAKIKYLLTLVRREALRQFDLLSADVESTRTLNVGDLIKGLVQ